MMSVMTSLTFAQQLPDPGFEDWSGAQFASNAQPKYWNFSNVSQLGVDKNFAHQGTGRSGKCLKIQDQFVGVGSLGATSPGYVALGHPWAYVSSLTSISDATAGTYGGISWTHRPDSMVIWIKRYYDSSVDQAAGDHTSQENFHLLYYAWSGTAQGESYKAKNGSCTNLSSAAPQYCVDEESDIRIASNGNECGTKTPGKQIAEGWFYQMKAYPNWTRISVPIYYLNDDAPQKCNVILSAGRYPEFRANNGIYAGSTMEVDDIQLIYSSLIQKLYIGGKEWKGFDPNSSDVQTYSLGAGATVIPDIEPIRGAGKLTNVRNNTTVFPGRRLTSSECTIVKGQVDGDPTTITVRAEDGSSTHVYRIKFVSQVSNNARLADIRVNGQTISGFNAYLTNYNIALPYGTTETPVVEATAQDATARVAITQPTSINGTSTIEVTASDGTTKMTYNLAFSVAALTDVTLKNIFVNGNPLPGYVPTKSNYTVSLPLGTTAAPAVTWESAYADGVQQIALLSNTLENGAQIQVSIPGTTLSKTYKLTYKIEASSYSFLAGIQLDGVDLEGFVPEKTAYTITLPMGTAALPVITWTQGDPYQTVQMTAGGVEGVTRIEVTAANGSTTTYRLTFKTEKSSNNALAGIAINGEALENFDADTLSYHVILPAGTTSLPKVTYTQGDAYQTVALSANQTMMTVRLTVTAGDGSIRVYTLVFEVEKSANALLQMIYLNNQELDGFQQEKLDYSLVWTGATMPHVTVLANEGQSVAISTPASYGLVQIVVTPEEGSPNTSTIRLSSPDEAVLPPFPTDSFHLSDNAQLAALYIDGNKYEAFDANTYLYTYPLEHHTYQVPAIMPVAATAGQTITIEYGSVNRPTYIRVLAADKTTSATYIIRFTAPRSSNTALASVEIEGVNFTFNPATLTYTGLQVPYGLTLSPAITAEPGEPEQSLVITEAPIGAPSTIVVTAEDGTQATYRFSYSMDFPNLPNELVSIVVEGYGALDLSQGTEFEFELPFDTDTLKMVSIVKNYPEQKLQIVNGGPEGTTTITVKSLNPAEADKVYTLKTHLSKIDPAMLTDIKVNGTTIPQFQPNIYNYVISVADVPSVAFTEQSGAEVDDEASNEKFAKLVVTSGSYTHTYTVTFFYPGDFSFDLDFENWSTFTQHPEGRDGVYPAGWNATINAPTTYPSGAFGDDTGYYWPEDNVHTSTKHTSGTKSAQLKTCYVTKSSESMPGILSLSPLSISLGYYTGAASTITFGAARTFRNTPDQVQLDYNIENYNRVTGWQFIYKANGTALVSGANNFSGKTNNTWYTLTKNLTYEADFNPEQLDIQIVSAETLDPNDYRIGSSGLTDSKKFTSSMYVDNLRFSYNSTINGIRVNGVNATKSGNSFTVNIDAESVGVPELVFDHPVSDQMPIVTWSAEKNNQRTATIRVYGEDLQSYTDYTLLVKRLKSTKRTCTWTLDGMDLTVYKGSPYQTITVTTNDTAYVITVKAENNLKHTYYASWNAASGSSAAAIVTTVPAEVGVSGTSTARLAELTEEPVLNYSREYALDSIVMVTTDTCHLITVYGVGADTTYVIRRHPSDNALLASMTMNDASVPGFYDQTYDYIVSLASLDAFEALPQDSDANVQYTFVPIDAENTSVFVLVTAADGVTQRRYSVLVHLHTLATDAYLVSLTSNEVLLPGFQSSKYDYTIQLPAGSAIPQMASVACDGASVVSQTEMVGSSAVVTFTVTSEDGLTQRTYTVNVNVLPSDACTLTNLFVGDGAVDDFASDKLSYSIELPYGTTALPEIDYIKADRTSTVNVTNEGWDVTVTVTAEDGVHQTVYTIHFTIAKSTNADLQSILLDGEALENFFVDEYTYAIQLPYGTELPVITAIPADSTAVVTIEGDTITVVAEDGIHTNTYVLNFTIAKSTNALLQSIELNGVQQRGFDSDEFVYLDSVSMGSEIPEVTWIPGDDQQQIDTVWTNETQLTITVTAGDGITTAEYTLTFEFVLSSNWHLSDLQVNGATIDGFHSDSVSYTIIYPIGTPESELVTTEDVIRAIPVEEGATVTVTVDDNHTITVFITAPDGTVGVYTIEQFIMLSGEARLRMIWLDDKEVRAYHIDTFTYVITLVPGSVLPAITAEPLDTLATWELGIETEIEDGKRVEVYGEAQNGATTTYTLLFKYANWSASSVVDPDDYIFYYAGNGQYKAVTIGIGIQFAVYDAAGRRVLMQTMPVADPADVYVTVDPETGNQTLVQVDPAADGITFAPDYGKMYFYVFFDSKTKKIAKGGKFVLSH